MRVALLLLGSAVLSLACIAITLNAVAVMWGSPRSPLPAERWTHRDAVTPEDVLLAAPVGKTIAMWDRSPIVLPGLRLVFFSIPKTGCTVFKQLFRRAGGHDDWLTAEPHDPTTNGLRYLYDFSPREATDIMNDDYGWTKVVFVRDPLERLLSAYLDRIVQKKDTFVQKQRTDWSFPEFVSAVSGGLWDNHWQCVSSLVNFSTWGRHIQYVGRFSHIEHDVTEMFDRYIGGGQWRDLGLSGWGDSGMFGFTSGHTAGAAAKLDTYYNDAGLIARALDLYRVDYEEPRLQHALEEGYERWRKKLVAMRTKAPNSASIVSANGRL